jgi:sec-independent protein translocase protein TatA
LFRNIGWPELLLIAIVVLLIFGGKRIPEIMRSLGSGIKEFKKGVREGEEEKPVSQMKSGNDKPSDQKNQ